MSQLRFSFEFFPARSKNQEQVLFRSASRLAQLEPDFVSVTYGASGSSREGTHQTVNRLRDEVGLNAAAHLTCVGTTRETTEAVAMSYWRSGIRHIVALRGDPFIGTGHYEPFPGGFPYASDLVLALRKMADFEISVAAYPETHPEALSPAADLENLKKKMDAGASRAITQFFFEAETFLRFRDRAAKAGIDKPIVPGILPIRGYQGVSRFAQKCGAKIPSWLGNLYRIESSPTSEGVRGSLLAFEMCRRLALEGVREFHFYTLNRTEPSLSICAMLRQLFDSD